jgi:pilus assembly protein CpaB
LKYFRPVLIIFIALVVGAIAVSLALHWLGIRSEVNALKVVVATRDLPSGTQLQAGMLEITDWPSSAKIKDAIDNPSSIYQRVVITPILRGEPVLAAKLAASGEKGGLSALIHPGSRAVTVKVNEIVGVAGFALPGNYVDVMVNARDKFEMPISKIVLERILVLALAQDASTSEIKPRVVNAVTLEVSPDQAEKIDLARSIGALSLVLRSQVDTDLIATKGVHLEDLFVTPTQSNRHVPLVNVRRTDSAGMKLEKPIPVPGVESFHVIRGITQTAE